MATLSKGTGVFDLSNSDKFVGSLFSIEDTAEILEIDRERINEFSRDLDRLGLITEKNLVDEKSLYRHFRTIKKLYSSEKTHSQTSLDEYVLKRVIARALPEAVISQQYRVTVPGSSQPKRIDFKVETENKTVFIEFDGPSHYTPQFGRVHDSTDRKKAIEDATGFECIIWPYWIQRCEKNVQAIFKPSIKGLGALWSTHSFFGDFTIPDASKVIIEETKRFNAVGPDGFGYFYGGNNNEQRCIVPHSVIKRILKNQERIKSLIPPDWDGDDRYWLPEPLWGLL